MSPLFFALEVPCASAETCPMWVFLQTLRRDTLVSLVLVLLAPCVSRADAQLVQQPLPPLSYKSQPDMFLHANDSFALDLLMKTHEDAPNHNIVVAPLPVSLIFAALSDGTQDSVSGAEFRAAFNWYQYFATSVGAKMVLARFAKPKPYLNTRTPGPKPDSLPGYLQSGKSEELWLSAAFLYRGEGSLSHDFIDRVTYEFGIPFRAVGEHAPQSEILLKNWDPSLPMPKVVGSNDFWVTSFTHLRTSWAGNTFAAAGRAKQDFHSGVTPWGKTPFS